MDPVGYGRVVSVREGARVAVVGAGPGGLVAAKHALDAGLEPTVFEASDDLGGQWHTAAAHSGIWPGMHTNTSRGLTAFSDLPPPADHPLHPSATQMHAYLREYAARFGVTERIRFDTPVALGGVRGLALARRRRAVRRGGARVREVPCAVVAGRAGRVHR